MHLTKLQLADYARRVRVGDPLTDAERMAISDHLHASVAAAPSVVRGRRDQLLRTMRERMAISDHLHASVAAAPSVVRGRRDQLLRTMRERRFAGLPITRAADELLSAALRYETTVWPRVRDHAMCPHGHGSLDADLWRVLRHGKMPARRRLIDILA